MPPDLKEQQSPESTKFILRPYQFDYIFSKAKYPACIAAWGTGKSMSLIARAMIYANEIPNNLIYVLRREWVDLKDSTIKDFELYTGLTVGSDRNVKLPNGSVIMFRHIEELNRAGKNLQNVNLGAFFIEQAEELPTDREFFILHGRLRRKVEPSAYFKGLGLPYHTGSIIGNVSGDNWIKKYWKTGPTQNFHLVEAVTQDNAQNLPKDFIDGLEILREKKPDIYRRYVLNDWSAEVEGRVFKNIENCIAGFNEEPKAGFTYTMGLDLAKSHDWNVIAVMCRETKHLDYFERWHGTSWNLTKERVKAVAYKYNNALVVPDATGVGDPIVEELQREGIGIYHFHTPGSEKSTPGVKFTNINKENMIEKLRVAIEQRIITFPNHDDLIQELNDFEVQVMPSKNYRYQAPEGKFDDCVISLALAVWALGGGMYETYKPPKERSRDEEFWDRVRKDTQSINAANAGENSIRTVAEEEARAI